MSVVATAWALDARRTGPMSAEARLVLVALADHADQDGRNAWPSQQRLADRLGITSRAVRRSLATLQELGLIVHGDQRVVSHVVINRRPVVWDLDIHRATHTPSTPRADGSVRADVRGRSGGTEASAKPKTEPPTPPNPPTPADRVRCPGHGLRLNAAGRCEGCEADRKAGTVADRPSPHDQPMDLEGLA